MSNRSSDLEYLESYLMEEYGIVVIWGKGEINAYFYDDDFISINTNSDKEIQLFCLLHEAGHLILRRDKDFSKKYPHVHKEGKTQLSKVDVLREELNSWEEGRRLAEMLGITINEKRWDSYWRHQFYKYVRWANN